MSRRVRTGVWVWVVVLLALPLGAAFGQGEPKVAVRVVADREPLVVGQSAALAVELDVREGWHVQSARPHEAFLVPATVKVSEAAGLAFEAAEYPVGKEIESPGISAKGLSVYEGRAIVLVPVTVAAEAAVGERTVTVSVRTQACDEKSCLAPVTTKVNVKLDVAAAGTVSKVIHAEVFAAARGQKFYEAATTSAPAAAETKPTETVGASAAAAGVDVAMMSDAEQVAYIEAAGYRVGNHSELPLWVLILSALAGGAILNIMPCVLPVIPLKVLGLVQQAHGDRRVALGHGLVFAAGIVSLFVVLAVVLKSAGLFYGQQFQSAAFLTAMAMVVLALALSMLGVWTINTPQAVYAADRGGTGYTGSFMNGLLATLLATPCSAPYLGPVLTWALVQPVWVTVLGLGLVGVGMSLPYVVLAMFPAGLARLPRAGRWSELLKQGLGLVMVGVAVYLIVQISNVTLWPWVLAGALVVAAACWGWGQIPTASMEAGTVWGIRAAVVVVGIAAGAGLYWLTPAPVKVPGAATVRLPAQSDGKEWLPFNVALLNEGLRQGRPVVVDWGASWCINCRVVEATVLYTREMEAVFAKKNAVLLRADESAENRPVTLLKRKLGNESIPVLAVFGASRPREPVVLRDVYTRAQVTRLVSEAK